MKMQPLLIPQGVCVCVCVCVRIHPMQSVSEMSEEHNGWRKKLIFTQSDFISTLNFIGFFVFFKAELCASGYQLSSVLLTPQPSGEAHNPNTKNNYPTWDTVSEDLAKKIWQWNFVININIYLMKLRGKNMNKLSYYLVYVHFEFIQF